MRPTRLAVRAALETTASRRQPADKKLLRGQPTARGMIGNHRVDRESRQQLVDQDNRNAIVQALLDDSRGRCAGHHHDGGDPILEHTRHDGPDIVADVGGVQQHALETIGEQRRRYRREKTGVERLLQLGSDQSDRGSSAPE